MRKAKVENPRYPHYIKIVRRMLPDRYSEQEYDEQIVYEGKGRSYTDTTTTGDAKVQSNKRKASIPMRFDKWPQNTTASSQETKLFPMSGDLLYVTKGNLSEEWEVKDFEPDNDRSVVYGEMNRNLNVE